MLNYCAYKGQRTFIFATLRISNLIVNCAQRGMKYTCAYTATLLEMLGECFAEFSTV